MARLELSRSVNAPPSAVFAFVDAHSNYHWVFRTPRLTWTTPCHRVGSRLKMELKLAGVPVLVEFETTAVTPDRRLAGVITSGGQGKWEWRFEPDREATKVTLIVEYELPMGMLGRFVDRVAVERGLRSDLNWTMDHVKKMVELRSRAA